MGYPAGTIFRGDCGAVVLLREGCPDPPEEWMRCACGAEMLPVLDGQDLAGAAIQRASA